MKNAESKRRSWIIAGAVELGLTAVFAVLRLLAATQAAHPVLLGLCDGLCMSGLLLLFWAVLVAADGKGELDGLLYVCRIASNMVVSEKVMQGKKRFISYHEFRAAREHRERKLKPVVLTGTAAFVLSLLLFVIYRLLP